MLPGNGAEFAADLLDIELALVDDLLQGDAVAVPDLAQLEDITEITYQSGEGGGGSS